MRCIKWRQEGLYKFHKHARKVRCYVERHAKGTHWGFNAPQALGSAILVLRAKPHGLKIAGEMGKSFGHCFKTGGKYEPGMAAMFTSKDWSFQ